MAEAIEANSGKIGTLGHGYTYGGHPVACAVGVKAIEIYQRIDMPARVRALAPRFAAHLDRLAGHPLVGEARHLGLMGGARARARTARQAASPSPARSAPALAQELIERGVISRAIGDTLAFCPPMTITEAEIDEMFAPARGRARRHRGLGEGRGPSRLTRARPRRVAHHEPAARHRPQGPVGPALRGDGGLHQGLGAARAARASGCSSARSSRSR